MRDPCPAARPSARQIAVFAAIGVASTIAYVALFSALRTVMAAVPANAIALFATAIGNTAANRRWTFEVRGTRGLVADHLAGLTAFLVALAITSGAAFAVQVAAPTAGRLLELTVLLTASAVATAARFLLLRTWFVVARPAPAAARATPAGPSFARVGIDAEGPVR